jgi:hypothetical protein
MGQNGGRARWDQNGGRVVVCGGQMKYGAIDFVSAADEGMPFGYSQISISGPAHDGDGSEQGLDKLTWSRRRKTLIRIRLELL